MCVCVCFIEIFFIGTTEIEFTKQILSHHTANYSIHVSRVNIFLVQNFVFDIKHTSMSYIFEWDRNAIALVQESHCPSLTSVRVNDSN